MTSKPEVLASRVVARSRLFEIREVDLRFANGTQSRFERLAARSGAAVLVVPMPGPGRVLLAREYAAGVDRYELGLPKGRVEPGEDPMAAADRELREELGFRARRLEHVTALTLAPGYIGHATDVVLARELHPAPLAGDEPERPGALEWPLADLTALVARDDCTEARTLAALYIVRDRLAAAESP